MLHLLGEPPLPQVVDEGEPHHRAAAQTARGLALAQAPAAAQGLARAVGAGAGGRAPRADTTAAQAADLQALGIVPPLGLWGTAGMAEDAKQRFELSADGLRVRAAQGHTMQGIAEALGEPLREEDARLRTGGEEEPRGDEAKKKKRAYNADREEAGDRRARKRCHDQDREPHHLTPRREHQNT